MNVSQVHVRKQWKVKIHQVVFVVSKDVKLDIHGQLNMESVEVNIDFIIIMIKLKLFLLDIDECAVYKHNCTFGQRCENMPGTFR